eukprot:scaffold2.g6852.t1
MSARPPATPLSKSLRRLGVKDERVEDVLMWRNPVHSGAALGGATAAFAVLRFGQLNLIVATSWALLAVVLGAFAYNKVAGFTGRPPLPVPRFVQEGVSEAQLKGYAEKATALINRVLPIVYRLLRGKEPALTFVTAICLYVVARLAGLFSLLGLAFFLVLFLFSVPKVYELKQAEIDKVVALLQEQISKVLGKVQPILARIPRYSTVAPAAESTSKKEE